MDVLIRLYNMVQPAADGSIISRAVTDKYLASDDYQTIIRDRIALGGKTHKDRVSSDELKQVIGPDDEVLVKRNSLFYIKKIFTKPDSDYCWAIIHIYDPDNFSGELRDEIMNLRAMLKEGTKLPCSVVIQAIWSPTNECLEIIRIKGVDFTLNPSFAGAGTEKLMSVTVVSDAPETKMFSDQGARTGVRLFSILTEAQLGALTPEVTIEDGGEVVYEKDILNKYGRNSDEYKAFSFLKNTTDDSIVKKKDLSDILAKLQASDSSISQEEFLNYLQDYVTPDNKELYVTIFNQGLGKIQQLVNAVPKTDPNYNELIKIRLINYLNQLPQYDKLFSMNTIINDRMSLCKFTRVIKCRYLIRLYQQYYSQNQKFLDDTDKANLERLYISDWMNLIKEAIPTMRSGLNISTYYQLSSLNPELAEFGRNLSFYYRKMLICEGQMNYIPAVIYEDWSNSLNAFLESIIKLTFGQRISNQYLSFIKN